MEKPKLWNALNPVNINSDIEEIQKISYLNNTIYLLTTNNNLYYGNMIDKIEISFKKFKMKLLDIDCYHHVYTIDMDGNLSKYSEDLTEQNEVVLSEKSKVCFHGHTTIKTKTKMLRVAVGEYGMLLISDVNQLWACGNMSQLNINSDIPKKVSFFEGRTIYSACVGKDFAVVIVGKQAKTEDTDSDECEEDVFVSTCPHCVSTSQFSSPESLNSTSETCPLGLAVCKSAETASTTASITSKQGKSSCSSSTTSDKHADDTDSLSNHSIKQEKNIIFRNTEAAKEFLTRQFSWVSAGEGYLAECTEKPTRIIKENVSNVASLVYEGVKTVGDKVVTLSRHVSGSSETNDPLETSLGDEYHLHLPRVTSKDEFMWSLSQATSEKDLTEQGVQERCNRILNLGSSLLNCEVWTWGNVIHGQLGVGDTMKRERPSLISKLSNIGALKLSTGHRHAAILTLDGRALVWGQNNYHQVTADCNFDQSSPRLFATSENERIKDISCGNNHTALLYNDLKLVYIGKGSEGVYNLVEKEENAQYEDVMCCESFTCVNSNTSAGFKTRLIVEETVEEQKYLEQLLAVYQYFIKPLQRKNVNTSMDATIYESFCRLYGELLNFTAANVLSLLEYDEGKILENDTVLFKYFEEHVYVYKNYVSIVCDIITIGGISYLAKNVEIPQIVFKYYTKQQDKTSNEHIINWIFTDPLKRLDLYIKIVDKFSKIRSKKDSRCKEIITKWKSLIEEQASSIKEAIKTQEFWLNSGKNIDQLKQPDRRLIKDSHKNPISLQNAGRFSSHWFVLLSDVFVHVSGYTPGVHNLKTIWVEPQPDDNYNQNIISLKMPEETITLFASEPEQKHEWFQALQHAIKVSLNKITSHLPPSIRQATYTFAKNGLYKDAKYTGRWLNGKLHGTGKLEWPDGKTYTGQFNNNQIHGFGRMDTPNVGVYEGQWRENLQNGFGILKYTTGDVYKGLFKDGLPHGHGSLKQGHFMASAASVYIGEWVSGCKHGYGVMDDIGSGEKYLGMWADNKKNGNGLIVTSDGIYYEGVFNQDVFTGHGLVIFEDGTHYEGEFRSTGTFSGKGVLTLNSGNTIEGTFSGSWSDGIKISTGTLQLMKPIQTSKPKSFGMLSVNVQQKWKAIFRHCYQILGVPPDNSPKSGTKVPDAQKIWQNVAVITSSSHQGTLKKQLGEKKLNDSSLNKLDTIPQCCREKIDSRNFEELKTYLGKAFESQHHPLGSLLTDLILAYTTTYGGLRSHPLLLSHAVAELHSITSRLYQIVRLLFPALPPEGIDIPLNEDDEDGDVVSCPSLLYPILLPKVHSSLFILYTLHNRQEDSMYWKRLLEWNKQPDYTLLAFLGVDQKFWTSQKQETPYSPLKDKTYVESVEMLQQLKTTFSPYEKLLVIRQTFQKMTEVVQHHLGQDYRWTMDDLFPVFHFVVVRARILQLGSEIHFIEDFMEPSLENGELGIMFITLKACYHQILQEKTTIQ